MFKINHKDTRTIFYAIQKISVQRKFDGGHLHAVCAICQSLLVSATIRKTCQNTDFLWNVFSRINTESMWKYKPKKTRILTYFTQCYLNIFFVFQKYQASAPIIIALNVYFINWKLPTHFWRCVFKKLHIFYYCW